MIEELGEGLQLRHPLEDDHGRVLAVMNEWWGHFQGEAGSQQRALLLPRLFFQHFTDTSFLVERADSRLVAFLIGFLSSSQPEIAYIHFVGVDPMQRKAGLGAALYRRFFSVAAGHGAKTVNCITSPTNVTSLAFHTRLGFDLVPSSTDVAGIPVQRDYDGPGLDRVAFTRPLGSGLSASALV